jgi:hypothetical protein
MTCIIATRPKRHLSAKLAAGLAMSAFLALGTFVASADAQPRPDQHRDDHRDHGRGRGGPGGYYPAPPVVVYGAPYYAPPPIVYGPAVGVYLPGITVQIP